MEPSNQNDHRQFAHERADITSMDAFKKELSLVGWSGLIPFRNFAQDKMYTLVWVQFVVFAFSFPFLLMAVQQETQSLWFSSAALSSYFAIVWGVLLHRCIRPETIGYKKLMALVGMSIASVVALVVCYVVAAFMPLPSWLRTPNNLGFVGSLPGITLGIAIPEELTKLLPVLVMLRFLPRTARPTTIAFVGFVSGLVFGAMEAVLYSDSYAQLHGGELLTQYESARSGQATSGASPEAAYAAYLSLQFLRMISLPFLHGVWTGTAAYFAGLSGINPAARRVVIGAGLLGVSILHGLYDAAAFSQYTQVGLFLALVSLAVFISYIRDEEAAMAAVLNRKDA